MAETEHEALARQPDAWLLVVHDDAGTRDAGKRYVSCVEPFHSTETATAYPLYRIPDPGSAEWEAMVKRAQRAANAAGDPADLAWAAQERVDAALRAALGATPASQ